MSEPSPLFARELEPLRRAAGLGPVLDLACGSGRHALAAARLGLRTLALDRDRDALRHLEARAAESGLEIGTLRADLEAHASIPLAAGRCGAVLVFRYLHRALSPGIEAALCPGGLLLYETFTVAQRALGYGPRRDAFLLEEGELPQLFPGLEVLAFDEGVRGGERPAATARLVARRPPART